MEIFLVGTAAGLAGFPHCLGMCGGFMLHFSRDPHRWSMLCRQLLWLAGKLTSYAFLGALAGFAGDRIRPFLQEAPLQNIFSVVTGLTIIGMGIFVLGVLPVKGKHQPSDEDGLITSFCRTFLTTPSPGAALTLGVAAGFLPCPVVLAMMVYAIHAGSIEDGIAVMSGLGAGTLLPLFAAGAAGRLMRLHLLRKAGTVGGILLMVLGTITIIRGTSLHHRIGGCPSTLQQGDRNSCCSGNDYGDHRVR